MVKKQTSFLLYSLVNILFPLIIGLFVYAFIRSDTWLSLDKSIHINETVAEWIGNYVPDIVWAYSLASCIIIIVYPLKYSYCLCGIICISMSVLSELSQKYGVIKGTFDVFDIFLESFAIITALIVARRLKG